MTHRTALMWSPTFFPYFFSTSLRFMARGSNTMHKWFLWKKCLNLFIIGIQFNSWLTLFIWFTQKIWMSLKIIKKNSQIFIKKTRILGRFAPTFYFNCEHVLIVNIEKRRRKKFRGFSRFNFFYKDKKLWNTNF